MIETVARFNKRMIAEKRYTECFTENKMGFVLSYRNDTGHRIFRTKKDAMVEQKKHIQ